MKHNKPFQKFALSFLALGAALLLAQLKCNASPARQREKQQSQQTPPPSPAPPASSQPASELGPPIGELPVKRRKVWTNDDVVQIRTPADNYELEKEAKMAAEAKAAAKEAAAKAAANSGKQPSPDIKLPATAEETEKMLKKTQGDIQEETTILDNLHKELLNAPSAEQAQKQKEIDGINGNLETLQRNLKALEDHLQTLHEKSQGVNPPAPVQPPS